MDFKPFFEGDRRHLYYNRCNELCNKFAPHADGVYPQELIECRRPNEPLEVKEYRFKIWKAITKPQFTSLVASLGKIRRSSDWSIKYPTEEFPKIAEGESLEDYCEENYPYFTSLTNWVFGVLLKKYLTDPNGVILMLPLKTDGVAETEYLRPYPFIFDSCHVYEYEEGERAILVNPEGCYYSTRGKEVEGKSYYIVTRDVIEKWDQIDARGNYNITMSFVHNMPTMPAFKIGAVICETKGTHFLYESRIEGILPHLDEALREYSDLQAAKVLHIFPERWEYTSAECRDCKGLGRRINPTGTGDVPCETCGGRGIIAAGPFNKMLIKLPGALDTATQIPNPPAGYVEKDVEIVRIMEESVDRHIYKALAAINFQFIAQTPLNQSGVAKEVDKEELNNTVHGIAEDLVRVMDTIYKYTGYYRYQNLYSFTEIDAMLPAVAVPEHYDLLSSQYMQTELDTSKKAGLNPVILNSMEEEYASKRFADTPEIKDRLALILRLDPLPNVTDESKMTMLSNKGISQESYVISSNIYEFVQRALDADPKFPDAKLIEQKAKMLEYAKAQIAAGTVEGQVMAGVGPFEPGDSVTVKQGSERDPAHAGVSFQVTTVNNGVITLTGPDGVSITGYSADQLQAA